VASPIAAPASTSTSSASLNTVTATRSVQSQPLYLSFSLSKRFPCHHRGLCRFSSLSQLELILLQAPKVLSPPQLAPAQTYAQVTVPAAQASLPAAVAPIAPPVAAAPVSAPAAIAAPTATPLVQAQSQSVSAQQPAALPGQVAPEVAAPHMEGMWPNPALGMFPGYGMGPYFSDVCLELALETHLTDRFVAVLLRSLVCRSAR
jgi:hypothetical protein